MMENYGLTYNDEVTPIITTQKWEHGMVQKVMVEAPHQTSLMRDFHTLILTEGFGIHTGRPKVVADMWFDNVYLRSERTVCQVVNIVPKGCELNVVCHYNGTLRYTIIAVNPELISYLPTEKNTQRTVFSALNRCNPFIFQLAENLYQCDNELHATALMTTLLTEVSCCSIKITLNVQE
jgi:hypothetical protein